MPSSKSPPIAVADATPWTWEGTSTAIDYQVRFYPSSKAVAELAQTGGSRDVTVTVLDDEHYTAPGAAQTTTHTNTLANAPLFTALAGEWQGPLGLGNGQQRVTFVAVQNADPATSTHYRIRVRW